MKSPSPELLKLVKEFGRPSTPFGVARVPGSGRVFFGGSDFKVSEADVTAAKFEATDLYSHESYVTSVALAGTVLVSGGYDGKLVWWDTAENRKVRTTDAHAKWVRRAVASPDGAVVASVAVGGMGKVGNIDHLEGKARIEVFDWAAGGKPTLELQSDKFAGLVNALRYAPDGAWLLGAGGAAEGFFLFADVAAKKLVKQEKVGMHVHDVALNAAADTITAAGHNRLAVYALQAGAAAS